MFPSVILMNGSEAAAARRSRARPDAIVLNYRGWSLHRSGVSVRLGKRSDPNCIAAVHHLRSRGIWPHEISRRLGVSRKYVRSIGECLSKSGFVGPKKPCVSFRLIACLILANGRLVSVADLIEGVWGDYPDGGPLVIDVTLSCHAFRLNPRLASVGLFIDNRKYFGRSMVDLWADVARREAA